MNSKIMLLKKITLKNKYLFSDSADITLAKENKVNINAWINFEGTTQNVGDWLSVVIVNEVAKLNNIDINATVEKTKHLYAVGSILPNLQDATIWGSGFLKDITKQKRFPLTAFYHKHFPSTDVRAVRGPLSKEIFERMGIHCPDVFGDPAILMPMFYQPKVTEEREYILIPHYNDFQKHSNNANCISTWTNDYKAFIDKICSAKLVISSSLHGIILAEAYGKPAIMLKNSASSDTFKYRDYYLSTGRNDFPIVSTLEEALKTSCSIPDSNRLAQMQHRLLEAFPKELWK